MDPKDTDHWITSARKIAITQGVGWVLLGGVLYGIYILIPQIAQMNIDAYSALSAKFTNDMKAVAEIQLQVAKERTKAIDMALMQLREDEREDKRLLVEILKRTNLSPEELRAAIDHATEEAPSPLEVP